LPAPPFDFLLLLFHAKEDPLAILSGKRETKLHLDSGPHRDLEGLSTEEAVLELAVSPKGKDLSGIGHFQSWLRGPEYRPSQKIFTGKVFGKQGGTPICVLHIYDNGVIEQTLKPRENEGLPFMVCGDETGGIDGDTGWIRSSPGDRNLLCGAVRELP
jgi:hypothetical protein